jgi:hypothetical protein
MKIVRKNTAVFQILFLIFLLAVFCVNTATATQPNHSEKTNAQSVDHVDDLKAHKNADDTSTPPHKADTHQGAGHVNIGEILPLWSCIPFAGILLSIALFPLFLPDFWHHHFGKISAFWAATLGVPFLIVFKGAALYEILHIIYPCRLCAFYYPAVVFIYGFRRDFITWPVARNPARECDDTYHRHIAGLMDGHHRCSHAVDPPIFASQQLP